MKAPCLKCTRSGCGNYHDCCPEYQKFKKEKADMMERKHKEEDIHRTIATNIRSMKSKGNAHKVIKSHKK